MIASNKIRAMTINAPTRQPKQKEQFGLTSSSVVGATVAVGRRTEDEAVFEGKGPSFRSAIVTRGALRSPLASDGGSCVKSDIAVFVMSLTGRVSPGLMCKCW